tara:strand:- start:14 stop:340 length:327 start_codon:yes stop_codon:yes gene_type:complete
VIDLASIVLRGFQDDIISAFGETAGWLIGHLIILGTLVLAVVAIRERDHILNQSGFDRTTLWDALLLVVLTLVLCQTFTSAFGFESVPSLALAAVSAISIRWMVNVLG